MWKVHSAAITVLLTGAILINPIRAEGESGTHSGKAYFEYVQPADTDADGDYSEFQFTRFYFAYDVKLSDNFAVRYRLDGDRKADGNKWRPFLKHAYLSWKGLVPTATAYFGIQGTPNWSVSEKEWGYRGVEKTIMDKNKIGSSADVGAGLKGKAGAIAYHVLYANGEGYSSPESNNFKKIYAQVGFDPVNGLKLSVFIDHETQMKDTVATTYGVFAGYGQDWGKLGVEYFSRDQGDEAKTKSGVSIFGSAKLNIGDIHGNLFGRYDIYDPDTDNDSDEKTYFILGYDYQAHKKVHVMPNIRGAATGDEDTKYAVHVNFEYKF